MECIYSMFKGTYFDEATLHIGYGISAKANAGGKPATLECFEDLCCDEQAVSHLVRLCNELELDPVHLRDVADDFIEMFV